MCGRFVLASKLIVKKKYMVDITPNYNISPSSNVLVLDNTLTPKFMRWSFSPSWAKKPFNLINARVETILEKPSFKNSLRCIFLADGFFEWKKEYNNKVPFYHYFENKLMYLAGIYNNTSGCCIVTRESIGNASFIHNRQPLILEESMIKEWINNNYDHKVYNKQSLIIHQVNKIVNYPKNNSKKNIIKID